ncbi:MAG: AraC family transcriptional regulator [Desulfobacteraceae bacterium]|nr:AraC family transcriptional regulator [Desulfobacteraceae bacterium]
MEVAFEALRKSIARWTDKSDRVETAIPELILARRNEPSEPVSIMYEPRVCMIAQGAKRVQLGDDAYVYDAHHFLVTSVDLPTFVQVIKASPEEPYLGLVLKIDQREISQLIVDSNLPPPRPQQSSRGMATGEVTLPLLTAFQRLIDLLDEPKDIPILAPIIQREIFYRLLVGDQGARLRQMASAGSQSQQIARAIYWLKSNFTRPLRIDDLAAQVNMSISTLHHHFRQVTAMSPLQYQKWLRLNEARRLMLTENKDATTAAFQVGYESPSQFSREYSRLFGAPPLRDVTNLRQMARTDAG